MAALPRPQAPSIVRVAENIVLNAKWHLRQQEAARRLARRKGLAWTPLFSFSQAVQLVAFDGRVLGRVYCGNVLAHRWDAVATGCRELGTYPTVKAAARALARDAEYGARAHARPQHGARPSTTARPAPPRPPGRHLTLPQRLGILRCPTARRAAETVTDHPRAPCSTRARAAGSW